MKKIISALALLLVLTACGSGAKDTVKYRIGAIQLADHASLDAAYQGMHDSLDDLLGEGNYAVDFKNAQGDNATVEQIVAKFVNDDVDLIYAIATPAAQAAYNQTEDKDIPVVFNAVTDPVAAGLVDSMDKPGGHVSGVSDISPVEKQLKIVQEILPNVGEVGILYNVGEANSISQIATIEEVAAKIGLKLNVVGVSEQSEIPLAVGKLVGEVDALYNITDNMMVAASATLIDAADGAKIPVFASEDGAYDLGILATESLSYYEFGKAAAGMIKEILVDGKDVGTLEVVVSDATNLYVNEEVAKVLGIELPASVTDRATDR